MGTLETVADYLYDTRVLLQDTLSPYRYDDPSLVAAFNTTLLEGRRVRPDLFVYQHGPDKMPSFSTTLPSGAAANFTLMPVDIEYPFRLAFVFGTVAHALMRDQEDISDARATAFMNAFRTMLIGTGAAAILSPPGGGGGGPPPGR